MRILILPGDGIGPEITQATRTALEALDCHLKLNLELIEARIGLAALAAEGTTLPAEVITRAQQVDGIVLGPVSTFEYPPREQGGLNPSAEIRKRLDLFANIRPSRARTGVPSKAADMDLVVVRENTEGFYADRNMYLGSGEFQPSPDIAIAMRKISVHGCQRIATTALELAQRRRKLVTMVHKANVLKVSDGLFRREVQQTAERFSDVKLDEMLIDATAAMLIRKPDAFDVLVTTNMYGDILSDEAAELAGGLGLAAALNAGDKHAVAQAVHGSAPDIAGRGIANPTALMLSTAMLLDWLGVRYKHDALVKAAAHLDAAIDTVLTDSSAHTPDLGGNASTDEFSESLVRAIEKMEVR
ncbi:MAG: isocitrate/isopropylmalate family dehydrogenase [Acidiferrobacterales bacterium]|nr:isocitrate/isopropylmalate family dehydrogenase [Acidiferrobacterales bacterium]